MPVDLTPLENVSRVLFTVALAPLQGDRFQPTGFPSLGAATYQAPGGSKLLVESVQSMANRMEVTCWDAAKSQPIDVLNGISHVTVLRKGAFLTDTMIEAHRLNSPYILEGKKDRAFVQQLTAEFGGLIQVQRDAGPVEYIREVAFQFYSPQKYHPLFTKAS